MYGFVLLQARQLLLVKYSSFWNRAIINFPQVKHSLVELSSMYYVTVVVFLFLRLFFEVKSNLCTTINFLSKFQALYIIIIVLVVRPRPYKRSQKVYRHSVRQKIMWLHRHGWYIVGCPYPQFCSAGGIPPAPIRFQYLITPTQLYHVWILHTREVDWEAWPTPTLN